MDNTIIVSLLGIVGVLLGVLLGGRMSKKITIESVESSNRNAIEIMKRQEFNKAAIEFQCAFLEAWQQLRDDPEARFGDILNSKVLLEHEKAALRFKLFLSGEEKTCFDQVWNAYFTHRVHPGDRHTPEKQAEEWNDENNCKVFIKQIERLLSYAKLK